MATATALELPNTAILNGQPVPWGQANEPDPELPTAATVHLTVTLAFDDLVAALFVWDWDDPGDPADPTWATLSVVEAVVNLGLSELAVAKSNMADASTRPGTPAYRWLLSCQQRAHDLLATLAQPTAPANGRHLAGALQ